MNKLYYPADSTAVLFYRFVYRPNVKIEINSDKKPLEAITFSISPEECVTGTILLYH